jgi:hypothetical protein
MIYWLLVLYILPALILTMWYLGGLITGKADLSIFFIYIGVTFCPVINLIGACGLIYYWFKEI